MIISVEKYCQSFIAWLDVSKRKPAEKVLMGKALERVRSKHAGEAEIKTLCDTIIAWSREYEENLPDGYCPILERVRCDILKSNLLARLIYGGEELRIKPCPRHKGRWSGMTMEDCPERCSWNKNITGWLPNGNLHFFSI